VLVRIRLLDSDKIAIIVLNKISFKKERKVK